MRQFLEKLLYSFPVQLVLVHIRRNLALLLLWALFIAIISGNFGRIYGVNFLFLDPEYIDQVGFLSFFIVGICYSNLVVAFNITCYILDVHRFSFIGVLERPFTKFSINNSLIPLLSFITYLVFIVRFQLQNEYSSGADIIFNIAGLFSGISIILLVYFWYFKLTNKDIFKYLTGSVDKTLRKSKINRSRVMSRLKESKQQYDVKYYFDLKLKLRNCQGLQDFYDKSSLIKVFDQNHLNSVIIELIFILVILALGYFMENTYFQIPAAASVLLFMAIIVMTIGAVTYWFKGWSSLVVIVFFLVTNFLFQIGLLQGVYEAKGLRYDIAPAQYSIDNLMDLNSKGVIRKDSISGISLLNSWKKHQTDSIFRPIFICVSGGGQRAALWTVNGLLKSDSVLKGRLMNKSVMITGASGGMIGAAYFRELYKLGLKKDPKRILSNISKDNLNSIIFGLLANDAFFRIRRFEYEGMTYKKDRGYTFENNLNKNLEFVFSTKVSDYRDSELKADIPLLLMSPVIANDGRTLYVSSTPMSYMNIGGYQSNVQESKIKGIGLSQLLSEHGADDLSFLTALRMSASFPYITPTISLPTEPKIEVMDAGIADNYGISDAVRFIMHFREWFEQNTTGITLLIIRDSRKNAPIDAPSSPSLTDRLTNPISNVYNNLGNIQDINNDDQIQALKLLFDNPIDLISLEYNTDSYIDQSYLIAAKALERKRMERASLSWHLTTREKKNIIDNISQSSNQNALLKLDSLFH